MAQEKDMVRGGEFNQQSFVGGMNLLSDDSRLQPDEYRIGFNLRNRYDKLDLILSSLEDTAAPPGIKQEMTTIGDYQILFVSGKAYYKLQSDTNWIQVDGFQMSAGAPRLWTEAVPVTETNYLRMAATSSVSEQNIAGITPGTITDPRANSRGVISINNIQGAAAGNTPGLLVQDNINQPRFIFIGDAGIPICRTTQSYSEWYIKFTDEHNTTVVPDGDKREYVPIGNLMKYSPNGILYIVSPDKNLILQSVTGRPLDFVRNVTNLLSGQDVNYIQKPGGDAYTTAYSVGVGNISVLKIQSDGSLFVGAGNANFSVSFNYANNAPLQFGEYTLVRKFLFNAVCLSDRAIFDSIGDTRFIDMGGVRSFNAIQLNQGTEGSNSAFSSAIKAVFSVTDKNNSVVSTIEQYPEYSAAVLFDDYEIYALNTIFGPALAVYDTINSCWSSFDLEQTGGKRIKQLVKIELEVMKLYAITEDDKVYQLYAGPGTDTAYFRTVGICSNLIYGGANVKLANPRLEIQLRSTRVILNNISYDCFCSFTPYVNNRQSQVGTITKNIRFITPVTPSTGVLTLADVDTQLENLLFTTPNCNQGWKIFGLFTWNGGSITQLSCEFNDITPMNPLNSQTTS